MSEEASEQRGKIEHRLLPVRLTPEELRERGDKLANYVREYDQVEAEKKDITATLGDRLKKIREEMSQVKTVILSESEQREVEIYEQPDYNRGMMDIFRKDDGTQVDSRALTRAELQQEINFGMKQIENQMRDESGKFKRKPKKEDPPAEQASEAATS